MGFYSPATLIKDAERHGQEFAPVDVLRSDYLCTLEGKGGAAKVRIGLNYVRGLRKRSALELVAERTRGGAFTGLADLVARVPSLNKIELRSLSLSGALASIGGEDRRAVMWEMEKEMRPTGPLLKTAAAALVATSESPLPMMEDIERIEADFHATGLTTDLHPMALIRPALRRRKVMSSEELATASPRDLVTVCGAVICRQRPGTANGVLFISLEDETGISNFIVMPDVYERFRRPILESSYMLIKGQVEKNRGTVMVKGLYFERLSFMRFHAESHDFH
jgi:error-prone DNA polymerase